MYNVTMERLRVTNVDAEKQDVLDVLSVCF